MKARDVMTRWVVAVAPETPARAVAAKLAEHGISAAPVVGEDGDLLGIVSEADLIRAEDAAEGTRGMAARDLMTRDVLTASEDADASVVARLMLTHKVKRIPIVSGTKVTGVLSRSDFIKVMARSDPDIKADVEALLAEDVLSPERFSVEVSDGAVRLTGAAAPAARRLAQLLARGVPGVVDVSFARPPRKR